MGTQERDAASNGVSGDDAGEENDLTIEQLAAESGMTVRNIRSHRARGLLPAPEVRDRVGYYGPQHLTRLRMILELQADVGRRFYCLERRALTDLMMEVSTAKDDLHRLWSHCR